MLNALPARPTKATSMKKTCHMKRPPCQHISHCGVLVIFNRLGKTIEHEEDMPHEDIALPTPEQHRARIRPTSHSGAKPSRTSSRAQPASPLARQPASPPARQLASPPASQPRTLVPKSPPSPPNFTLFPTAYLCAHHMRACVHACVRACVHACVHACVRACMRASRASRASRACAPPAPGVRLLSRAELRACAGAAPPLGTTRSSNLNLRY